MKKCETCKHYVDAYQLGERLAKWLIEHGFAVEGKCSIGGCKDFERYEEKHEIDNGVFNR